MADIRSRQLLGALFRRLNIAESDALVDRLLKEFGSLGALLSANPLAQQRIAGDQGEALALLGEIRETILHTLIHKLSDRPILSNLEALIDYLKIAMADLAVEQVRGIYLNAKNYLLKDEIVTEGTFDRAVFHPREIIRRALELGASGLVLVHNHPSGDPAVSEADLRITRHLARAAHEFDIELHDHIIVAQAGWASLREAGAL